MEKHDPLTPLGKAVADAVSDVSQTRLSGRRKVLRFVWVLALCLAVVGAIVLGLFLKKTSWLDAAGYLHEPLFGLLPISWFLFLLAIVLALFDGAFWACKRGVRR